MADMDSVAEVEPSCTVPMPRSAVQPAQSGWSTTCGYYHLRRAGPDGRRRRARTAVVHDGGHSGEQGQGPGQPRAMTARRPRTRIVSMVTQAMPFEARMLMLAVSRPPTAR
ncbi:MAG: hypothetical protein JO296_11525 [Pseudonocardiales bacterium]|nr:hypothetical protein [Pseudonocardiales bacterium]MBV9650755.1 hypothetical protein [Pseudonocardiales bacterium]